MAESAAFLKLPDHICAPQTLTVGKKPGLEFVPQCFSSSLFSFSPRFVLHKSVLNGQSRTQIFIVPALELKLIMHKKQVWAQELWEENIKSSSLANKWSHFIKLMALI